jgi:putative FmdB family regulatory protein
MSGVSMQELFLWIFFVRDWMSVECSEPCFGRGLRKPLESREGESSRRNALPLYEYRCTSCGYSFEKIQSFKAEPETVCPKCQGVLIRPVTAPALRFEGAGWYVNDYAGKGAAKPPAAAGETKPDSGSDSGAGSGSGDAKPAAATPAASAPSTGAASAPSPSTSSSTPSA